MRGSLAGCGQLAIAKSSAVSSPCGCAPASGCRSAGCAGSDVGVDGPGPRGVELDIGAPMLQRMAGLAHLLVGESDVVVRVRIGGR